jgi:predicted alpha/beta hydrolase family esterase
VIQRLRLVLGRQNGPTIVAGHSYGGQIMTALGTDAPNVVGLVYIAAFGLDEGESIGKLLEQAPPTPALAHLDIDSEGYLVADGDQAIPPEAERRFAARMGADTIEVASNHVAMVSHPDEALERILTAASSLTATS